jgi:acyl-homoserine lactone acylase PvdQ
LLQARERHDWHSMAQIQADLQADYLLPVRDTLCAALAQYPNQTQQLSQGVQLLQRWQGQFSLDSAAATLMRLMRDQLAQTVFPLLMPAVSARRFLASLRAIPRLDQWLVNSDDPLHTCLLDRSAKPLSYWIQCTFEAVMERLANDFGADPATWVWARVQYLQLGSLWSEMPLLGRRWRICDAPFPGDLHTVSATVSLPDKQRLRTFAGASSRFICDLAQPEQAWFAQSTGPSALPTSVLFTGSTQQWLANRYFKSALWPADQVPEARERVVIIPTEFP